MVLGRAQVLNFDEDGSLIIYLWLIYRILNCQITYFTFFLSSDMVKFRMNKIIQYTMFKYSEMRVCLALF